MSLNGLRVSVGCALLALAKVGDVFCVSRDARYPINCGREMLGDVLVPAATRFRVRSMREYGLGFVAGVDIDPPLQHGAFTFDSATVVVSDYAGVMSETMQLDGETHGRLVKFERDGTPMSHFVKP